VVDEFHFGFLEEGTKENYGLNLEMTRFFGSIVRWIFHSIDVKADIYLKITRGLKYEN
jgi:hypothetical protein